MIARASRPISQVNSHPALHYSFKSNVEQQCYRLRSSTRASSAARLHPRPKSERPVGAQPHRLRGLTRAISSGRESRRRGVKLIHGSTIKSHGKPCRFNYLFISNRR
jgi:hypothetical protein